MLLSYVTFRKTALLLCAKDVQFAENIGIIAAVLKLKGGNHWHGSSYNNSVHW